MFVLYYERKVASVDVGEKKTKTNKCTTNKTLVCLTECLLEVNLKTWMKKAAAAATAVEIQSDTNARPYTTVHSQKWTITTTLAKVHGTHFVFVHFTK